MKKILLSILAIILFAGVSTAAPDRVSDAVAAARKAPKNQNLNRVAAEALRESGKLAEAIPYYMKSGNQGNLGAAEVSFYLYDFDNAREYLDKYLAKRSKAEAEKEAIVNVGGDDGETVKMSDYLGARIELGRSMLDRVEKIQVIDSMNVPADRFFEFLRLSRDAGSLQSEDMIYRVINDAMLDSLGLVDIVAPAYLTESGDDLYWIGADIDGISSMMEISRLSDGSWDQPRRLFDYASIFGNNSGMSVSDPFLLPDGVTLYFSADGDESLGGLDIFISRRDADGEFLQPSNIGMPYNSPYNDYLLVIDEYNGVGWWASDRTGLQDSVTIYTFIPQELRINYEVGTPHLADYARLNSISSTWVKGTDYDALKKQLARGALGSFGVGRNATGGDFDFALPDGRVLHRVSDFKSSLARNSMIELLKACEIIEAHETQLQALREKYAKGDKSVADDILRREKLLEQRKRDLLDLSNTVVQSEH